MFKWLTKYKNLAKILLVITMFILAYSILLYHNRFFTIARLKTIDLFYNIRHRIKPLPSQINDIVVITIDDESFNRLQKKWPLERTIFSQTLEKLTPYNPRVVAIDISFIGESADKNKDIELAKAIRESGNVVLSSYIGADAKPVIPLEILRKSALGFGFVNKPRDKDSYVRNARAFYYFRGLKKSDFSFEVKTAAVALGVPLSNINLWQNFIILKGTDSKRQPLLIKIPIKFDGTLPINYRAKVNEFRIIPLWKVLKNKVSDQDFRDKIVLLGAQAEVFHDIYQTPFGVMPGVFINANEVLTILGRDFINPIPDYVSLLISVFLGLVTCIFVYNLSLPKGFILSLAQALILFLIGLVLFLKNIHVDSFSPVFIVVTVCLITDIYKHVNLIIESQILKTQAITDGLTGLFVHRYFRLRLDSEFERAQRAEQNLSLLIMDIDHFKNINDTYGHENGNVVLKHIAHILSDSSRKVDVVARYGGEEFCAILPETAVNGASVYAQRLRKSIENYNFPISSGFIKVTMSFGIASYPSSKAKSSDELIVYADKALYRAKQTGRNRVCSFDPTQDMPKDTET